MLRRRKQNSEQIRGLVAKLRQGIGALLANPKVDREARRGADELANDPRLRRKVRWQWAQTGQRSGSVARRAELPRSTISGNSKPARGLLCP